MQFHLDPFGTMRTTKWSWVLVLGVMLSGCIKDDLDVSALNNNPFDPAYVGPPIFEPGIVTTELYNSGGNVLMRLRVRVDVRTDHFLSTTTYSVRYRKVGATAWTGPVYMPGDPFGLPSVEDVQSGQVHAWEVQLVNGAGHGAENTVSVTVP